MGKEVVSPLVSIICNTYNHVNYIRQCLDGFLMQETNFPIEILVHDDASTDGTADIVREYEDKYPDLIKPIYQTENQYSKGVKVSLQYQYSRAQGKYIALCEGDDYWTDSLKLQKQVDFLEENPEYVMCSHRFNELIQNVGEMRSDWYGDLVSDVDYDLKSLITYEQWYTQPLSIIFRSESLDIQNYSRYKYIRDIVLVFNLLKKGRGRMLNQVMGVYRKHDEGIWTGIPFSMQRTSDLKACLSLCDVDNDNASMEMLYNRLVKCHNIGVKYIYHNRKLLLKILKVLYRYYGFIKTVNLLRII